MKWTRIAANTWNEKVLFKKHWANMLFSKIFCMRPNRISMSTTMFVMLRASFRLMCRYPYICIYIYTHILYIIYIYIYILYMYILGLCSTHTVTAPQYFFRFMFHVFSVSKIPLRLSFTQFILNQETRAHTCFKFSLSLSLSLSPSLAIYIYIYIFIYIFIYLCTLFFTSHFVYFFSFV